MASAVADNQAFFNKIANEYDQKYAGTLENLDRELKASSQFLGFQHGGRLLDYACGTGFLSTSLGDNLSEAIGIDVSENMVGAYNAKAETKGVSQTRNAYLGQLTDPLDPAPASFSDSKFFDFDVAGVGLALHHMDDCQLALERLAGRVKKGGVVFIVDFAPHQIDPSLAAKRGVRHDGFSDHQVRDMFEAAGVGKDFGYKELEEKIVFNHTYGHDEQHGNHGHHGHHDEEQPVERTLFIARGTKA